MPPLFFSPLSLLRPVASALRVTGPLPPPLHLICLRVRLLAHRRSFPSLPIPPLSFDPSHSQQHLQEVAGGHRGTQLRIPSQQGFKTQSGEHPLLLMGFWALHLSVMKLCSQPKLERYILQVGHIIQHFKVTFCIYSAFHDQPPHLLYIIGPNHVSLFKADGESSELNSKLLLYYTPQVTKHCQEL